MTERGLVNDQELARLRRIERAARAYSRANDGFREACLKFNVWSDHEELIYQSPLATELRSALEAKADG